MDKTLFNELRQSLEQAKAIAKGEMKASRRFVVPTPDVKAVRERTGLSQSDFARLMCVSIKTLQTGSRTVATRPAPLLLCSKSYRRLLMSP